MRKKYWPVLLIVCAGAVLSYLGYDLLQDIEMRQIRVEFEQAARFRRAAVRVVLNNKLLILESLRSLFLGSEKVEPDEFQEFVQPFITRDYGFQALEWLPRIRDSERDAFEASLGTSIKEKDEQGNIVPAPRREEYFPVHYIEPFEPNKSVLGFDSTADPIRGEALRRAWKTGEAAGTARIRLIQDPGPGFGFLVFIPVPEEGFVLGVFKMEELAETSFSYVPPQGIDFSLWDESAPEEKGLLYSYTFTPEEEPSTLIAPLERALLEKLEHASSFEVGGRTWGIQCAPTEEFIADRRIWYPISAVPVILLFTGIAAGLVLVLSGRKAKVERLVAERTAELKEAQLQLIQAAKLESVGRLAAGVAHEVKNPLAIIQLGVDYLVQAEKDREDCMEVVREMDDAVRRADIVVKGLVDFSRSEKLEMEKQDLNAVVEEALRMVHHEMMKNNITLEKDLAQGMPPLDLDRDKLQQVFINLFMNAIQAMGKNGSLYVRTYREDRGIRAVVEDTGPGIPEEKLDKVFDPFFTTKPVGQGTGLGLSVTRNIVELHNAKIRIRNREKGGARFEIDFSIGGDK